MISMGVLLYIYSTIANPDWDSRSTYKEMDNKELLQARGGWLSSFWLGGLILTLIY